MAQAASASREDLLRELKQNYLREREGVALYRQLAESEKNPTKKSVLLKLSEAEGRHAERWAARLRELGGEPPEDQLDVRARWR